MPEAGLRRALGRFCSVMGLLILLPVAYVGLSSVAPSPLAITAREWSLFFYVHFIVLVAGGLGLQGFRAARAKVFYGGPLIDFLLGVTAFMLLETFSALALRRGAGPSWPAVVPGALLIVFGLRLGTGRPLLGS